MSEEEIGEIMRLDGDEMDLKRLARSFPTGPVRVEKHGDAHFLFRESEGPREDSEVLADGADTLAEMNAIMLAGDPRLSTANDWWHLTETARWNFPHHHKRHGPDSIEIGDVSYIRLIGPDGKVIENTPLLGNGFG